MHARVLDPATGSAVLICGPAWSARCGAAGEGAQTVFCAGRSVMVDRETSEGPRLLRVAIPPQQRICPFASPASASPAR